MQPSRCRTPNPLLSGDGSWSFRSQPFDPTDPDDPNPNPETFEILDFAFSFAGHSFDETDAVFCFCEFTLEGDPLLVNFVFNDGTVSWSLSFSFHDGFFGFNFHDGVVSVALRAKTANCTGRLQFLRRARSDTRTRHARAARPWPARSRLDEAQRELGVTSRKGRFHNERSRQSSIRDDHGRIARSGAGRRNH